MSDEIELVEAVTGEWITRAEARRLKLKLKRRDAPKPQLPPKPKREPIFSGDNFWLAIEIGLIFYVSYWIDHYVHMGVHAVVHPAFKAVGIVQ